MRVGLRPSLVPQMIPPPPLPPHLQASRAVDPTLGEAETSSSFPGAASPSQSVQDLLQELAEKKLMKNIL